MGKAQNFNLAPADIGHKPKSKVHRAQGDASKPQNRRDGTKKLLLPPRPDWHAAELPTIPIESAVKAPPPQVLERIHTFATSLLEAEAENYGATHQQSSSSYKFMSTIMSSGTWSDKVSALTLVVQESPLHTLKPLENLVALAGKKSRTQALMALEALKDMLSQGNLLPADRKLRIFVKQPSLIAALQHADPSWTDAHPLPGSLTKAHLIYWAYEDRLKAKYFDLLKIIESWCGDEVEYPRLRAVTFIWELLKEKPEQEENLLRLLVNKLGDTSKKVASKASHLLLQLQASHPMMKQVIVDTIESDILLRSGQTAHAKYYAIITLNQTVLASGDAEVPNKLLDVYFGLFITILNRSKGDKDSPKAAEMNGSSSNGRKRKRPSNNGKAAAASPDQELEEKIIAQVLTGINRAFPFSKRDSDAFEKHLDTMFKITHSSNFNTSVQALMLIQQISSTHNVNSDRYLRTLYESLLDPRLIKSSKHTMYLNLLYRSLKSDASIKRIKAFVKRILQIMELHEPPFACALLYLVIELQRLFPGVKAMLAHPEAEDGDDEEVFVDAPEDPLSSPISPAQAVAICEKATGTTQPTTRKAPSYDGRKRDPAHSNADAACLWELLPWTNHYHPSVSLFANHLYAASASTSTSAAKQPAPAPPPKPDPTSHTLIQFLDRFVYRNPKTKADGALRGTSLMQPALAPAGATDALLVPGADGAGAGAGKAHGAGLNSEAFWSKDVADVKPDEVFFHRYFSQVGPRRKAAKDGKAEGKDGQDEDGDVDVDVDGGFDGEFGESDEEEIWKALRASSGADIDGGEDASVGDEDEDEDVAMFDYEDSDDEAQFEDAEGGGVAVDGLDGLVGGDEGGAFELEDDDSSAMFSSEEEGDGEVDVEKDGGKDKEDGKTDSPAKTRRKKLKSLPTFASAEDYAHLIDDGAVDEDDGTQV